MVGFSKLILRKPIAIITYGCFILKAHYNACNAMWGLIERLT